MKDFQQDYHSIRNGKIGYYNQDRGLLEVSGGEAVQFLNGLITNDIAKLLDGEQMLAAFPTVKGRMFAVVRVLRQGESFLFETEEATRQKVYDNLFRFTFAGDFHLKDLSKIYEFYSIFGNPADLEFIGEGVLRFQEDRFIPRSSVREFRKSLGNMVRVSAELYEVLRIENGIPKYGVDMDEETVVPEVGLSDMISYQKGCYIGQEVIARIHFRGRVAKQLTGLVFDDVDAAPKAGDEIVSADGKNAGKVTSVAYSPKLEKAIALAFVRNAYAIEQTKVMIGNCEAIVKALPL